MRIKALPACATTLYPDAKTQTVEIGQ